MRTLALLRHAHAAPGGTELADHDRALSDAGRKAALAMGAYLCRALRAPVLALCSSARRAVETFECLRRVGLECSPVRVDRAFYLASAGELLARLSALESGVADTLLVGHNPGIQTLAVSLAVEADAQQRRRMVVQFPPAGCALIGFESADWRDVCRGGRLSAFARPEDLEA